SKKRSVSSPLLSAENLGVSLPLRPKPFTMKFEQFRRPVALNKRLSCVDNVTPNCNACEKQRSRAAPGRGPTQRFHALRQPLNSFAKYTPNASKSVPSPPVATFNLPQLSRSWWNV